MTVLAILLWMALGALIALICVAIRGRRLWGRMTEEGAEFGAWLGRKCMARVGNEKEWHERTVVAVSHKGAVCVRRPDAKRGKWISKEEVPERVRWEVDGEA